MFHWLNNLDRRLIFTAMMVTIAVPVLLGLQFPETSTEFTARLFNAIESLPEGSPVLLSLDYDPASAAELDPMATAVLRHLCAKRHKVYAVTIWPTGLPQIDAKLKQVVETEFAAQGYQYGVDYVNLGYVTGEAIAPKLLAADFTAARDNDNRGNDLGSLAVMDGVRGAKDMKLVVTISAGFPGIKEWVQYAGTPYHVPIGGGCTGVAAPQLYPYFPDQIVGLMAAIKGAAEYEASFLSTYPQHKGLPMQAIKRMGPQLFGHRLVIGLIILGNVLHFMGRRRRRA